MPRFLGAALRKSSHKMKILFCVLPLRPQRSYAAEA